jgi:hypothetical protein
MFISIEGFNGEIELLTQKRTKIAIIPWSTELRNALEEVASARYGRKAQCEDSCFTTLKPTNHSQVAGGCMRALLRSENVPG